ncbi:hypothetical protein LCGC14_2240200 [marine sediment metagenome]|uniref:Uncharacterized protein n=1 Tax=marine sediment metagenome TaxID=412755 RepID=A0A0F9D5W0_9ZZZZ
MSREYTEDEVRNEYLKLVWSYIDYWHDLPDQTCREKLEGLAFGMLVILDGGNPDLPGFIVAPDPHPDDKEFCERQGQNWFPSNHNATVKCDIAGGLHELFHRVRK